MLIHDVSRFMDIIARDDFVGPCDQKSSDKRV